MLASQDPRLAGRVAFTYPNFVLYQLARFSIVLALEMQSVAVGWQVYEISGRWTSDWWAWHSSSRASFCFFLPDMRLTGSTAGRCCCGAMGGLRSALPCC
jgi:hypothetical protein